MDRKSPDEAPPRRVLLACLDNLGDLAFACALVPPLRRAWPEASIGVWSKKYAADLLPFVPGLRRVHSCDPFWDRAPGAAPGAVSDFVRTLRDVARERYDAVLLPHTSWRLALAARWAGIPRRVGFAQRGAGPWLSDALSPERRDRPVIAEWARLLEPLGVPAGQPTVHLEVPAPLESARRRLRDALGPGPVVGIHPFAGDARRAAGLAFWEEVLAELPGLGTRKILVVGRRAEARDFVSRARRPGGADMVVAAELAPGGLAQILLAVSSCRVFAGNDSGPLHCAAGLGVPVLGLYLPGDWPRAMPQGLAPWRAVRRASPDEASAGEALSLLRDLLASGGRPRRQRPE